MEQTILDNESTSSTAYVDLDTPGPSVTAAIRPSGAAMVTVGACIEVPAASEASESVGIVGVFMDGELMGGDALIFSNTGRARANSGFVTLDGFPSGLSPGCHTFELKYKIVGRGAANFAQRTLRVTPL